MARSLKNPHLLLYPLLLREAKLSSRIENTIASAEEVVLVEAGRSPARSEAQEVRNYIEAVNLGFESELPICNRLIRDMHRALMSGVRGDEKQPGEYRNVQAYIGRDGRGFEGARFVPPPPGPELVAAMGALERFANSTDHGFAQVVAIAMAHYQFEAIHPFRDGNGRIGRAIAALSLCKGAEASISRPLVYLSGYFDRHREEYYDRLLRVSTHGEWEEWIRFFLAAIADQAEDAMRRIVRVLHLRERFIDLVTGPRASSLLPKLVDELFRRPWVRTPRVAEFLGIQPQAAQRHIDRLVEKGILEEVTQGGYARVWVARQLLAVIEAEDPGAAPL